MFEYAQIDGLVLGGTHTWQLTEAVRVYIWRCDPSEYSINFQSMSVVNYTQHARSVQDAKETIKAFDHEMYEIAYAIFSDHSIACKIALGGNYGQQD